MTVQPQSQSVHLSALIDLPFNHYADDDAFHDAINDMDCHQPALLPMRVEELDGLLFDPFDINDDDIDRYLNGNDPDLNVYNDLQVALSCNYYVEDTFNSKLHDLNLQQMEFSLFHHNIRSSNCHLDELQSYLSNLSTHFSVIALSETWLNESNADIMNIDGYQHEWKYRSKRSGGGVSLFIKQQIAYKCRPDLSIVTDFMETLFVEIDKSAFNSNTHIICGVVYRPPNTSIDDFLATFETFLSTITNEHKLSYICGDFNLNLLNADNHVPTRNFIDTMYANSFLPLISKPTRVTTASATLLDHIYCNEVLRYDHFQGILYTGLTDHFPIFAINTRLRGSQYNEKSTTKRNYCQRNVNEFCSHIRNTDWSDVIQTTECQESYNKFHNKLHALYSSCFPIESAVRGYKNRKPWLSNSLKTSIKRKNHLFVCMKKNPTVENTQEYKNYHRQLRSLLRAAEKQHYDHLFKNHKGNLRKSWGLVKEIINRNKSSNISRQFKINNEVITDESSIANHFNNFFAKVGPSLASKIPNTNKDPLVYIEQSFLNSMSLELTDPSEIFNIINGLKESSAGWDEFHIKILKQSLIGLMEPILHVFNLSLQQGCVPIQLKKARVIPLFKSGDKMLLNNHRPISILPALSKVLERLMYNRLVSYIDKHNILAANQYGFRSNHGSNLALISLIDKIVHAQEKNEVVCGIFLDLSKAFDTVNHKILFKKLYKYGVRGLALNWFKSYLSDRSQYVLYNNTSSNNVPVTCGVPQGSVLGPLLFLLYINDLPHVSKDLYMILFADDTNVFLSGKDINDVITRLNLEMSKLVEWLHVNKLSLNLAKTHYMVFRSRNKKCDAFADLSINGTIINRVSSTKFLGVILEEHLQWTCTFSISNRKSQRALVVFI